MRSSRIARVSRWLMIVVAAGVLPGFVMRCDKAALNIQRGFFEGLGLAFSEVIIETGLVGIDDD